MSCKPMTPEFRKLLGSQFTEEDWARFPDNGAGNPLDSFPEHNTDSETCWCSPDIEIMENGAKLIIHRETH